VLYLQRDFQDRSVSFSPSTIGWIRQSVVTARIPHCILGCLTGVWLYIPRVPPLGIVLSRGTRRRDMASLVNVLVL